MQIIKLAPSVLSADLLKLERQVETVIKNGADFIHVDVMDGHFVPNITFGPGMVSTLKRISKLPLDVHLMISDPDKYIPAFVAAGASILTVHQEMNAHLHSSIQKIKQHKVKAGVALNPATDLYTLFPLLAELDLILLMTVNPGFGGQKFIKMVLDKIRTLAEIKRKYHHHFLIEVDGGIDGNTIPAVVKAGAEVLVMGSAIFKQKDIAAALKKLKKVALQNVAPGYRTT
jgi:ribulose-phosphate 3-epimerase